MSGFPEDYVELHVDAGTPRCSLLGWQIDDSAEMADLTFGGVVIESGGYAVFYEDDEDSFSFGLSRRGDEVHLCSPDNVCTHLAVGPEHGQDAQCFTADRVGCFCDPTPGARNAECQGVEIDQAQGATTCIRNGMDYGHGARPDGTDCGNAPTVALYVDRTGFEPPSWYAGPSGRVPRVDRSLHDALYCQTLCRHTEGCDFFAYEYETEARGSFHECYLKAGHEDSTCDQYTPWTNGEDPEYFSASGPKLCTPERSEYYWTDTSGMMGWQVVNGTGAGEHYTNGVFHSGMESAGWSDVPGDEWLYSGLGPHPFSERDGGHEFFIIRSPAFYGPKMATWIAQGGIGRVDSPGPNEGAVSDGFMGWVLRDDVTGEFVASTSMCRRDTYGRQAFMGPAEWRAGRSGSSAALTRCQTHGDTSRLSAMWRVLPR
eukprot:SAG22_NODE_221_length_14781_cov_82.531490_2_plen_429_part_00